MTLDDLIGPGQVPQWNGVFQELNDRSHLAGPVSFFFDGLPLPTEASSEEGPYIDDFLAISEGLALTKYFMCIKDPKLRRRIVELVEHIAGRYD